MKTIKLIKNKQGWLARFENDTEIMALFGTDTIPTPYTENALPMMVKNEIMAVCQQIIELTKE